MITYNPRNRFQVIFSYRGTVIPAVATYLGFIIAWTLLLLFIYYYFGGFGFEMGIQAHTAVSIALGLMLVFRTNASYDRYWEGRKLLDALGSVSRSLAVKAHAVIPDDEKEVRTEVSTLIGAFVLALKEHLREGITSRELAELSEANREALKAYTHPLNGILNLLSVQLHSCLARQWMHPPEYGSFNESLDHLQGTFRALDRIRYTPLPFAYVNQLKVFMLIFFMSFPIVLIPLFEYWTIFVMVFVVYGLVGIEEIGIEIEDPFGDDPNDLPIEQLCQEAKRDVAEILEGRGR